MKTRVIQRGLSVLAVLGMTVGLLPASAFAATLNAPTNLSVVGGKYTNDTTPTFTWTNPGGATWYEVAIDDGTWIGLSNVNSYTSWTLGNGWHGFYVRAHDNAGHTSTSASIVLEIDTNGATIPAVSPSTAREDQAVTFEVTPYGEATTMGCDLFVNGSDTGNMTKYGNTFRKTFTFTTSGTHSVYAGCWDGDRNYSVGPTRNVSVSSYEVSDDEPEETFSVGTVSPSTAIEDESVTMRVSTSGTLDADSCLLYVDGSSAGYMTETSSNNFSKNYTFTNDGSYSVYAYCEDENGDWERGSSRTVTVSNDEEDETFWVNQVSPGTATEDKQLTLSVSTGGDLDADACILYVDGDSEGYFSESSSNSFSKSYTFTNDGSYSVYAYCEDENGDWQRGNSRTVTVSQENDNDDDTSGYITVGRISPSTADEDERTEFTVNVSATYNVTECWLYVDGDRVEEMDESPTNTFSVDYTFRNSGDYSVYAYCKDSKGNTDAGDKRTVHVDDNHESSDDDHDNDYDDDVNKGSLIKTACGHTVAENDPCTAVYYYGTDGKRHVFPNSSVYFTWYNDFDDVVEVSSAFMSSLTIGKNVTYRPGSVLVQFEGSSSVYAVEAKHTLRRYTTTSLLESDYGSRWESYLVTVPDSLYSNYSIGSVIDSSSDYDRTDEYYSVDSIDDVL